MRTFLLFVFATATASAVVPPFLTVQGSIRNLGGPVDGTYSLTVVLYPQSAGGTPIHAEGHPGVVVVDGVFAITLGESQPLPVDAIDAAPEVWVAIKVEGEPELPRLRLGSVAFALSSRHAAIADALAGPAPDVACTGCISASELAPGLLAAVATSGAYSDLGGVPKLAAVATSGAYSDLGGVPQLAAVATSGAYSDLSGVPKLAAVATSGDYASLTGQPDLSAYALLAAPNVFAALQTFGGGARVGAAAPTCGAATAGRIRFDSATGRMWLCDGTVDRRFQMCDDTCPTSSLVACGSAIKTACGEACVGVGSACAAGYACSGGSCTSTLGTAANPASSCKAILEADSGAGTATYWLKPAATASQVLCEMSKAGGGWTRVRDSHGLHGQSFADQTAVNLEGFSYSQILFVYRSGSAIAGPTYPTSLPSSNPLGFRIAGKNWGGATNWGGSTCGTAVDTYPGTYYGQDFSVDVGAPTTTTFQVALIEGMANCTTSDNTGPAAVDVYVK